MKQLLFIFLLIVVVKENATAQDTVEAIKGVINRLFDGMRTGDSVKVAGVFSQGATMQTIAQNKEGKVVVSQSPVSNFTSFVGKQKPGAADEQIVFETIKVDGELAFVWTPYRFIYNGNFSHSGVNAFCLVQQEGQWKIHYIIDTRRK